jgi:hypothetical protein
MLKITWSRGPKPAAGISGQRRRIYRGHADHRRGFCSGGLKLDNEKKPGVYPREI